MIAEALKLEIEAHARRARPTNPLLQQALAGRAAPVALGRYLSTLRFMIGNSPGCLLEAGDRAQAQGHAALAEFYADKYVEEQHHVLWADDDLQAFEAAFGFRPDTVPVTAALELDRFLRDAIACNPVLYLAYVFWAEYFVVLAGGQLVEALVSRCGFPKQALSCLSKHVVLDQDHAAENVEAIDRLVDDPAMLEPLRTTLRTATTLFDRACEEMVEGTSMAAQAVAS